MITFFSIIGDSMNPVRQILGSPRNRVRRVLGSSGGITLIETLVSISILTVVMAMSTATMFQVFSIQRFWTDDIITTRTVRHAGSWLAGDALNAEDVLDDGGVDRLTCAPAPLVEQMTLTWTDTAGTPHNVLYSVSGEDELLREYDNGGNPLTLTKGVVSDTISFTLCGSTLRATMTVSSGSRRYRKA